MRLLQIIEYENEDSIESRSVLALELLDECITKSISSDKVGGFCIIQYCISLNLQIELFDVI